MVLFTTYATSYTANQFLRYSGVRNGGAVSPFFGVKVLRSKEEQQKTRETERAATQAALAAAKANKKKLKAAQKEYKELQAKVGKEKLKDFTNGVREDAENGAKHTWALLCTIAAGVAPLVYMVADAAINKGQSLPTLDPDFLLSKGHAVLVSAGLGLDWWRKVKKIEKESDNPPA